MTCIAARVYKHRRVVFAADSLAFEGELRVPCGEPKVKLIDKWGPVGAAGDTVLCQTVEELWSRQGDPMRLAATFRSQKLEGDGVWLAYKDGRLFTIHTDGGLTWIAESYWAIGSAAEPALGALAHGASPESAVQIACKLRADCGGEVKVVEWVAP